MKSKVKFYKKVISFFLAVMMINAMGFTGVKASASTIDYYSDSNNGDGNLENVTLTDTSEAQLMVRTGDIDNFGYGWSSSFNPFSGNATPSHGYPFQPSSNDVSYANGTDRIMVTSGYNAWMYPDKMAYEDANGNSVYSSYTGTKVNIENTDGYTKTSNSNSLNNAVGAITMQQFTAPSSVNDATLQLFVDDFQAGKYAENGVIPNHRSKVHYKAYINNRYIPELSDLINQLNQSGPIGKLITFEIPQGDLDLIKSGQISIKIDDATTQNYSDGYAIDFIKLLINKKGTNSNTGTVWGYVKNAAGTPISKAIVSVNNDSNNCVTTGNDGHYELHNVPAGLAVIKASADNYDSQSYTQTVVAGTTYRQDFCLGQTGPKLTLAQSPDATTYTNGAVTITATGIAGTNSVKDIILPDGTTANGSSAQYQVSSNGTYTFEVDDSVGNSDIKTITISNIDTTPPSQPAISLNSNNQVLITPGVDNDGGSGVKETEYQIYPGSTPGDNQSWTTYQNSFDPNMQVFTVQAKTIDNAGNESAVVTQTFDIASIIRKHGIYDTNSNQNDYINGNNKIANGIPANLAMIIDAKAFNPTINLNIGDISKISDDNISNGIDVKEYEISNGTIGALIKEKNLAINNSSISISSSDGFVMNSGHEYMIVYTITPKGSSNDTIDMTANVKNTSNSKNLELQIQDMPDLF